MCIYTCMLHSWGTVLESKRLSCVSWRKVCLYVRLIRVRVYHATFEQVTWNMWVFAWARQFSWKSQIVCQKVSICVYVYVNVYVYLYVNVYVCVCVRVCAAQMYLHVYAYMHEVKCIEMGFSYCVHINYWCQCNLSCTHRSSHSTCILNIHNKLGEKPRRKEGERSVGLYFLPQSPWCHIVRDCTLWSLWHSI